MNPSKRKVVASLEGGDKEIKVSEAEPAQQIEKG